MATMKLALRMRRVGEEFEVLRWDYPQRAWVLWKGTFQLSMMGMRGSYRLKVKRRKVPHQQVKVETLFIQRWTESGNMRWEEEVPEGISAWDATGGGSYVLPWLQPDPLNRVLAQTGIELKLLVRQPKSVKELTVALPKGRSPDGQIFHTYLESDVVRVVTEFGVLMKEPTFAIEYEFYLAHPTKLYLREARWIRCVHVWEETASGKSVSPHDLLRALNRLGLSHTMTPWEINLRKEELRVKK